MIETVLLPFAPLDRGRKLPFSTDMEIAAIVCSAEAKRKKKSGILGGKPETITSIAKLYYPLWLIPWEKDCVAIDAMKMLSLELVYSKLANFDSFVESVISSDSYEQFVGLLQQNANLFKDFVASQRILLEGVVQDRDLQDVILEYYRTEISFKKSRTNEDAFFKGRIDKEAALAKVETIHNLGKKNQADTIALQKVVSALDDAVTAIGTKLSVNIENIKREFVEKIEKLRPIVEEKVRQLTIERDAKIKNITDTSTTEIATWTNERESLHTQLNALTKEKTEFEEKKQLAKLRKDEERVKRWKFSMKEREKRMSEISKKIRKLQEQINHAKREKEKTVKQTYESYEAQINVENGKIQSLEISKDAEIVEIQRNIDRMHAQIEEMKRQIRRLLDAKNAFAERLKELSLSWKLEDAVSLLLPFYVVDYLSVSKERYEFYAPVMASSSEGVLKAIKKKFWSSSLDARMGVLLRQRSKSLVKMFSSTLTKNLDTDRELHGLIREKMQQENIFSASGFQETLRKGLDGLAAEEWVKPEERNMVLQAFSK